MNLSLASLRRIAEKYAPTEARLAERRFSERARNIDGAHAFDGLSRYSLALACVNDGSRSTTLNVVLPEASLDSMFAGIRTAIEYAVALRSIWNSDLRLIYLRKPMAANQRSAVVSYVRREFGISDDVVINILSAQEIQDVPVGSADVWIATNWATAHALDVAATLGRIDRDRVVYLIQDYEPGFMAWSTNSVVAQSTYHAGFLAVVNSAPVADYLSNHENISIPDDRTFRPRLDLSRLESAARTRQKFSGAVRVLFYARPAKPRNLFAVGMTALSIAIPDIVKNDIEVSIASAGDLHAVPRRGPLSHMQRHGKLPWSRYFEALAKSDVLLSLQMSPHPSHPPLDAVVSGGIAVTNELNAVRGGRHERLIAVAPAPRELADAISGVALSVARGDVDPAPFDPALVENLGVPMESTVIKVAESFAV